MPIYFGNQQVDPSGISAAYVGETQVYSEGSAQSEYLYFENTSDSSGTVTVDRNGTTNYSVYGKIDDGSWSKITLGNAKTVPPGSRLYLECTSGSSSSQSYLYFTASNISKAGGNLASIKGDGYWDFLYLFKDMTSITDMSDMFYSGTGYSSMFEYTFKGCTNLVKGPNITLNVIEDSCCIGTFMGCSSLKVSNSPVPGGVPLMTCGAVTGSQTSTFSKTGGTYKGAISSNTTYYWYL